MLFEKIFEIKLLKLKFFILNVKHPKSQRKKRKSITKKIKDLKYFSLFFLFNLMIYQIRKSGALKRFFFFSIRKS